eukprot:EG_transcript_8181
MAYYTQQQTMALMDATIEMEPPAIPQRHQSLTAVTALGALVALGLMAALPAGKSSGVARLYTASASASPAGAAAITRPRPLTSVRGAEVLPEAVAARGSAAAGQRAPLPLRGGRQVLMAKEDEGPVRAAMATAGAFLTGLGLAKVLQSAQASRAKSQTVLRSDKTMTAVAAPTKYTLRYFDARGVVEVVRFLFAIAGVPYEDHRYRFTFGKPGDFSTISMPEFEADKAAGKLNPNMGRLPILEVNGVCIGQSKAIERYLARQFGFMGSNEVEAAQIDALCEHVRDIKDGYRKYSAIRDEAEKQAAMNKWYREELPTWCRYLEKNISSDRWAVGSAFSLADINIFVLLTDTFNNKEATVQAYRDCPRLKGICANVAALEGVQTWTQKRPPTVI